MRAIWSGTITFGLVTIPIKLYGAVEAAREVQFRLLDEETLTPIKEIRVNPETEKEVPWEQVVRGVELARGKFVPVTNEELRKLPLPTLNTVELETFVDAEEIDPVYYDTPYYLGPGKGGEKGYAVLQKALLDRGKVGVGKIALRQREHLVALRSLDDALILQTLRYADEVRDPTAVPGVEKPGRVAQGEVKMAGTLIGSLEGKFEPSAFKNEYKQALSRLVKAKVEKRELPEPRRREEITDLSEALKKSLAGVRERRARRHRPAAKKPTRRRA